MISRLTAICNGGDDTAAFQAAWNSLLATGGTLYAKNCFVPGTIVPGHPSEDIRLMIEGSLTLGDTFPWVPRVAISGIGGGDPVQFQDAGAVANISAADSWPDARPLIKATGDPVTHYMENIAVYPASGAVGIKMDGTGTLGANAVLRNVGIVCGDANCKPLIIDAWFWLWLEHFFPLAAAGGNSYSIYETNTGTSFSNAGIIHYDSGTMVNGGIHIDSQVANTNHCGGFTINHVILESGTLPFLLVDHTNCSSVEPITLEDVSYADNPQHNPLISNPATSGGHVRALRIVNGNPDSVNGFIDNKTGVDDYDIQTVSADSDPPSFLGTGDNNQQYSLRYKGITDADLVSADLRPMFNVFAAQNISQDVSSGTWNANATGSTVTGSQLDPLGTSSAYKITCSTSTCQRQAQFNASGFGVNDWFIAGVWVESSTSAVFRQLTNIDFFTNTGAVVDCGEGGNAYHLSLRL